MSAYSPDPHIRLYFLLNSAAIPLRSIAVDDARVHIDTLQATRGDKKWLTETSAGVVAAETVIGGGKTKVLVI